MCSVLYVVLLEPKKLILHPPYMIMNYTWRTSMFCCWYEFPVPSMNVSANRAQPMVLVFSASWRSAPQIPKIVSALLVYSVRCSIRFWDCMGLPPKSMQEVLSDEVTTTQDALPPDLESEFSLFANETSDPCCSEGPRQALWGDNKTGKGNR